MREFRTIIEPFKIHSVEPIRLISREERLHAIQAARFNLFNLRAEDVILDLLTDSGTGAMSAAQWGQALTGDESYAGSRSFELFRDTIVDIFGFPEVIPTHQGRAAERILFPLLAGPGKIVINNTHFDTTRANIEASGAIALDCPTEASRMSRLRAPFKGNMDLGRLEREIAERGREKIAAIFMTITNNSAAGQPVSYENIAGAASIARAHRIPFWIDACRFAENCFFIRRDERPFHDRSIPEIARAIFDLADGCTMSAKKDGLASIGGFLALRDRELSARCRELLILGEGFPTYGGLAGRDLAAIAQGLREVLDPDYLTYRIRSIAYVVDALEARGIPVVVPAGGHAIYLDSRLFLDHIPPEALPGQTLAVALYVEGGIRSCEIGTVMFGPADPESGVILPAPYELVRLAIPRRVYTQSHMDYLVEVCDQVFQNRRSYKGLLFDLCPKTLRHFTATFKEAV